MSMNVCNYHHSPFNATERDAFKMDVLAKCASSVMCLEPVCVCVRVCKAELKERQEKKERCELQEGRNRQDKKQKK